MIHLVGCYVSVVLEVHIIVSGGFRGLRLFLDSFRLCIYGLFASASSELLLNELLDLGLLVIQLLLDDINFSFYLHGFWYTFLSIAVRR